MNFKKLAGLVTGAVALVGLFLLFGGMFSSRTGTDTDEAFGTVEAKARDGSTAGSLEDSQNRARARVTPVRPSRSRFADRFQQTLAMELSKERDAELARLLTDWVAHDAVGAATFALGMKPDGARQDTMRLALQTWTDNDSEAALAWALQIESPDRGTALAHIIQRLAEDDPRAALERMAQSAPADVPRGLLAQLTLQWAQKDFAAASGWVRQRPLGEEHDALLARIAFVQSQTDPASAARLVVQEMSLGEAQIEAALTVLHQWALRDASAAAAWVELFPEGAFRNRAQRELQGIALYQSH